MATPAPRFDLPSRAKRMATVGTAIAAVVALVVVYVGWGAFFGRGGTGSNVVLALLLAAAAIYLMTTNVGPLLDDLLPLGGTRVGRETRRYAILLLTDLERALAAEARVTEVARRRIDDVAVERLVTAGQALRAALAPLLGRTYADTDVAACKAAITALEAQVQAAWGQDKPSTLAQARSLAIAFAIALALRAFVVEPFQIPSGSMIPTLLVGDHLFVARFRYGLAVPFAKEPRYFVRWSLPAPGDVVVFVAPPHVGMNAGEDWIKRVIAGPGQKVRIVDDEISVDGVPYGRTLVDEKIEYLDYEGFTDRWETSTAAHWREAIPQGAGDPVVHSSYYSRPSVESWPLGTWASTPGLKCEEDGCVVEDGFVFVMGDNRDNSNDGRKWGAVPVDNIKGKAEFIWMSVDGSERSVAIGDFTLPRFRWDRLFMGID